MANRTDLVPEHSFRTILLWLAWAAASVTVYLTLYLDADLWTHIQQDQSKIAILISGMFIAGTLLSFTLAISITNEMKQAVKLGRAAQEKTLSGVDTKLGVYAVQRFFASLKHVVEGNTPPDIEALIDVELGKYQRRSHAVGVVGNLLITLGLIGTVIGLTFILTGLTTSLDALGHDQERLILGLERAMAGMGTAFYTTLLGAVLGGVLLRIFALITDHGISDLSDMLKKICMVYCAQDTRPSLERDMRLLNAEIATLGNNVQLLEGALNGTKAAMEDFRQTAKSLHQLGDDGGDQERSLRESLVLQMYYSDLLKEEIKMMNRINRSWWARLRRSVRRPKPKPTSRS